jgi:hypothetical protein
MRIKPMIPVIEREKTLFALDSAVNVIGLHGVVLNSLSTGTAFPLPFNK